MTKKTKNPDAVCATQVSSIKMRLHVLDLSQQSVIAQGPYAKLFNHSTRQNRPLNVR